MIQALSFFCKNISCAGDSQSERKIVYIILKGGCQVSLGLSSTKMHEDYLNNCKKHLKNISGIF